LLDLLRFERQPIEKVPMKHQQRPELVGLGLLEVV
jgi:hypothetical protein|tara:strand:+ start:459 stop:563 length:105 start_codon:yes stop_codon:yes gene_type:complete